MTSETSQWYVTSRCVIPQEQGGSHPPCTRPALPDVITVMESTVETEGAVVDVLMLSSDPTMVRDSKHICHHETYIHPLCLSGGSNPP